MEEPGSESKPANAAMGKGARTEKETTEKGKKEEVEHTQTERNKRTGVECEENVTPSGNANKATYTGSPMQGRQSTLILRGLANFVPIPTMVKIPLMDQDLNDVNMELGYGNSKGEAPPLPPGVRQQEGGLDGRG